MLLLHLPCLRPGLACQAATETRQDRNFWQHVQLHQILPERQIDAGQVEGSHVDHQRSKYGRSSGINDRPPVVQHHVDQQVAHNARNASRALNVIKVLSAQPWANTPKILVNVVRALVRSRMSYGLESMPHLSKTGLARLTAIEVRGLRCLVYREAGLLPFRRHIQLICSKYVFRCQTVDNTTVDEITATFRNPSRLQSYSSICDLVCDLVWSAGLDGVEVATRPMHPYPPWLLERAHVEVDMEGLKKDQNPLVLAVTARLCLEENYPPEDLH